MRIGRQTPPPAKPLSNEIALCCIGRRENRYAREFVSYYKSIGFDKIFICDNNHDGEEHFEDVLGDYIESGYVEIFDYRNKGGQQCHAYSDIYREYGKRYQWIAFFDFDEYLTIVDGSDIHQLMSRYDDFNCVLFNWMNYGDNGLLKDDGRDLLERFTEPLPDQHVQHEKYFENDHIKCMVRGGNKNIVSFRLCPHVPCAPMLKCCDSLGRECRQNPFHPHDFTVAYLRHFITKTVEEFASNKWQKGVGDRASIEAFRNAYTGRFFKYNEWTQEKENIMRELTGVPPFEEVKSKTVVIVNYNTQHLTDCAIRSLNKQTPGCRVVVFDNSDKSPFVNTFDNVEVVDNTKGQVVDLEAMIKSYPDRIENNGSNFGSARHCRSIEACTELYPDGFLLMDSDVLVKKDVTPLFDASCVWSGLVSNQKSRYNIAIARILPFLCYVNVPLMRKHGIHYFNGEKMFALNQREPDKAYDTGAWFYEDCNNHNLNGNYINIVDYIIHYDHGSWIDRNSDGWLEENRELWE